PPRPLFFDGPRQGPPVALLDPADVEAEWLERRADRLLARDGERAHCPAVEAVVGGDHDRPALSGMLAADDLERRLVGLGARVAEEDAGVLVQQAQQLLG